MRRHKRTRQCVRGRGRRQRALSPRARPGFCGEAPGLLTDRQVRGETPPASWHSPATLTASGPTSGHTWDSYAPPAPGLGPGRSFHRTSPARRLRCPQRPGGRADPSVPPFSHRHWTSRSIKRTPFFRVARRRAEAQVTGTCARRAEQPWLPGRVSRPPGSVSPRGGGARGPRDGGEART